MRTVEEKSFHLKGEAGLRQHLRKQKSQRKFFQTPKTTHSDSQFIPWHSCQTL